MGQGSHMTQVKILIVDDLPENLLALSLLLKKLDVEVIMADCGNKALAEAQKHDLALILLDVQMPDMDGYEVANLLHDDVKTCGIPIIFITAAYHDDQHLLSGYQNCAVDYIQKPVQDVILLAKVTIFIRLWQQQRDLKREISLRSEANEKIEKINQQLQQELTVRKQAETAQQASEAKYIDLYDNAPDMYGSVDAKNAILHNCNQTFADELGYSKQEIIGQPIFDRYHPDCMAGVNKAFQQFIETGVVRDEELQLKRKDGSKLDVSLNVSAIRDKDDNIIFSRSTWRDISERKQARLALRKLNEELELRVMERTEELAVTKEKAEAANLAKSVFLANMSHELRTPMNAVLGFSKIMLNDSVSTPGQRKNLEIINRSGEHLLHLINDVLDMSKIEAGRIELEPEHFNLRILLSEVEELIRQRTEVKGLQLLFDGSSNYPPFVYADSGKYRQLLINLLGNAVKYTEQGGVTLRLNARPGDSNESICLIAEIEDTGIGISKKDLSNIFEPFVQVGEACSNQGTGLGLPITKQYVELMGGTISVDSELGKGSVFRLEVPVLMTRQEQMVVKEMACSRVIGLQEGQVGYRILIVEDQFENRLLLKKILQPVGFETREALNGEEAITIFKDWQPHFILMDTRMPVMDGIEATKRIKAMPGGGETVIVAQTASVFTEQREQLVQAGSADFIAKPYRAEEIFACLNKHLGVRFIYESEEGEINSEQNKATQLQHEDLNTIPEPLQAALYSAATQLDVEETLALIDKIDERDNNLALRLRSLVENMDFQAIIDLFQSHEA